MTNFPFGSFEKRKTEGIAYAKYDLHALNRFTLGRWLWSEQQQLACRYVKSIISALLRLDASIIGSGSRTPVLKISEDQYNIVFQLIMDEGVGLLRNTQILAQPEHSTDS